MSALAPPAASVAGAGFAGVGLAGSAALVGGGVLAATTAGFLGSGVWAAAGAGLGAGAGFAGSVVGAGAGFAGSAAAALAGVSPAFTACAREATFCALKRSFTIASFTCALVLFLSSCRARS